MTCDQIPKFDIRPWQSLIPLEETESIGIETKSGVPKPISELSPKLIQSAVQRAKDKHLIRKKFEYESWLAS